jgi:parallel beta-helix repeat protein
VRVTKKLSSLFSKTLYLNGVFLTKNNFIIVLVTCLTFSANFLFGQTNVSGVISANTTWTKANSPYNVTGNLLVNSGVTLTIDPGVEVRFEEAKYLKIEGTINAVGSQTDSIIFTSNLSSKTRGSWDKIWLKGTTSVYTSNYEYTSGSIFQFCRFSYAKEGLRLDDATIQVKNSTFINNTYGINFKKTTNSLLFQNLFSFNVDGTTTSAGTEDNGVGSFTFCNIIENTFVNNQYSGFSFGGYRNNSNNHLIKKNLVKNNGGIGFNFSWGDVTTGFSNNTIEQNIIYNNGSTGLVISRDQNTVRKNLISKNAGDGIGISGTYIFTGLTIQNNIIVGNLNRAVDLSSNNNTVFSYNQVIKSGKKNQFAAIELPSGYIEAKNNTISYNTFSYSNYHDFNIHYGPNTITYNNFHGIKDYYFMRVTNKSNFTIDASNNYWAAIMGNDVKNRIFDRTNDFELGVINVSSSSATPIITAPISMPINIVKSLSAGRVVLTWSANTESDIAGYKVYYGGYTGYSYTTSVDAGNVLTYTLPAGVSINDDIAVTAYDTSKDGTDDQFDGNESWYSPANKTPEAPADLKIDAGSKRIKLNWSASTSTGVNAYYVYRSTNGTTYAKVGSAVSSNFIDRGLTAQTKYYYKISAIDSLDLSYDNYGLESQFSDVVSASPNNIIYVAKNGNDSNIGSKTNPKLKISAASTEAVSGDSILINDGTYTENISYRDKQLSFIGINGATKVILKPLLSSQIMAITQNGGKSLFKGLTFADGGNSAGSAIYTQTSNPIIENCIFRNHSQGSILQLNRNNFTITNCLVYNNNANVFLDLANGLDSIPYINNITYTNNTNNWFYATGITTFAPNVKNSIIWNSSAIKYQGGISIENSIVKGGFPGTTSNIDTSPRFLDSLNNDFRLANFSPAIGLGRSISGINTDIIDLPRPGPSASNPDAGAYENIYSQPSPYVVADSSRNGMIYFKFKLAGLNNLKKINIYKGLTSEPSIKYQSINPNTEFTDTLNQEFNKSLHYRFTTVDLSDREGGFSNEIKTIAFNSPVLKAPLNLSLKIDTAIAFSWSKIGGASLYTLQFSKDSTFSTDLTEKIVADTFLVQNNLNHNSKYYWKVKSSTGKAYSKWSPKFNFKTFIAPPKLLSIKAGNKIDTLFWTTNSNKNIKYFKIYRDTLINPSKLIDSISGKVNTYIDKSTLQLNRKYYYRMVAGNFENEESEYSNVLEAIPFNSRPTVIKFENKTFNNVGEYNFIRATYSSYGSKDIDGKITKYEWFVNDSLVNSTDTIFVNYYKQGTNKLMLRITDNDGGKDSTTAYISLVSFTKTFKGAFYGGITALNSNIIYAADSNFDPINGASVSLVNRIGNSIFPLVVSSKIFTTPSVTADSSVFITSGSSLNGFNKTGAPLWPTIPLGGLSLVTPTIDSQFERIYLGVSNKNFFAIDSKTGKVAWNIISDAPINASAVITGDRKLIFTSDQGTIYGFDIKTNIIQQSAKWQVNLNEIITKSPAVDQNNNLILGTLSGKILKVKLNDNSTVSTVWASNLGSPIESSPVIDANGFIYIGTNNGDFYRINPENGEVVWKYQSGHSIKSTPAISEFGNIYFANINGVITAIDLNKVVKWKYNAAEPISANILYIKNMVYGGTESGKFFGIYDNPNTNTLNAGISIVKDDKSISYTVENKLASSASLMSNIIFNEQNTGIDKLNIVVPKQMGNNNSPATISGVVDKEPVWGTFQGNYRRTGSKAFDCPSSTISYTGSLILCEGNAIVLTASEGISYLWSTGETSKTITVNKAGDYSVTVTTLNGCSSSSTNVSIKTIALPQVSLSVDGSTSFVQGSTVKISTTVSTDGTFQWYKDDVLIPGAVGTTLLVSQAGAYKSRFLNASGCFAFSNTVVLTSLFSMSPTNYKISIFGESCSKNNDGKISITASQPFKYKASLMKGQTVISTNEFTGFIDFEKLPADKYSLCFTIGGQPDYKQCFEIVISEPKDLSVYSQLNPTNNILKLALSGGSTYRISLNGKTFSTSSNTYNLGLKNGLNKVIVMTDKECQGVYQEELYVNEKDLVYPNPFTDNLNIKIKQEDGLNVQVNIYDSFGLKVYQTIHTIQNGTIQLDLSKLYNGYYSVVVGKDVFKVLKK